MCLWFDLVLSTKTKQPSKYHQILIQTLIADRCTKVPGIMFPPVGPVHVSPVRGAPAEYKQTSGNMVYGDVMFPCWCLCKAQEGVAQQHSGHTLKLWVVTVWTDPSHNKQTLHELTCTYSLFSNTHRRLQMKQDPKQWVWMWQYNNSSYSG